MRKFGVFAATIFISIILAGIFGIIHDQVTYSISPEYFTKFKYQQFGFEPSSFGGHRQTVAVIGFLATWWVGLMIGIVIGFTTLIYPDHKSMRKASTRGIGIVFITAVVFGFIGFLRGRYYLSKTGVNWWLPEGLINRDDFITVGSVHNYSYLGGGIGLLLSVIYLCVKKNHFVQQHSTHK